MDISIAIWFGGVRSNDEQRFPLKHEEHCPRQMVPFAQVPAPVLSLKWDSIFFATSQRRSSCHESWQSCIKNNDTLGGRNPAPVDRQFIPLFTGFRTSQVVPDFFHQQYYSSLHVNCFTCFSLSWTYQNWCGRQTWCFFLLTISITWSADFAAPLLNQVIPQRVQNHAG